MGDAHAVPDTSLSGLISLHITPVGTVYEIFQIPAAIYILSEQHNTSGEIKYKHILSYR